MSAALNVWVGNESKQTKSVKCLCCSEQKVERVKKKKIGCKPSKKISRLSG